MNIRYLSLGLVTLLGIASKGIFIPYRYAESFASITARSPYKILDRIFSTNEEDFSKILAGIDDFFLDLSKIGPDSSPEPRWNQDWFCRLDAAAAYAIVRTNQPSKIIEVGSGHSTRFLSRAVRDGNLNSIIVAIDPQPRASLSGIKNIKFIQSSLQEIDLEIFMNLCRNDILFVDSSHILMPGSDVDILINRVLPILPSGVLIHFHDIFLPNDYPQDWHWRGYNEQLVVAPLITSLAYKPIFSSHYIISQMQDIFNASQLSTIPKPNSGIESSLWLRKA